MRSCCLVFLAFFLSLVIDRVNADLLVVLLQGSQIFTSLRELTLLHTLSHVPVDEGTLGVHQIKLVIQTGPGLGDGCGVAQHADGTLHLGQITTRYDGWWLVVDAHLEASWTPVHELDGALGLDGCDGCVDILGDDITTVQQTAGHVLAVTGIALDHLVGWLEAGIGDLCNGQLLVVGLLSRDDGGIGGQGEVDTWVGHQGGVGGQDGVVRLYDSRGDLGCWVDGKLQLGLLAVVDGETLHQQGCEARASASTEAVEDEEALKTCALVSQLTDPVQHEVNELFAHGVVTSGVVIGGILLACDQLLRVEELTVCTGANLIDYSWLQIDKYSTGDMLASTSLAEEGVEGVITTSNGLITGHLTIRLDAVLQAVQLPAGIAHLHSGLADMDRDTFTHVCRLV